jgi:hypothetical protein
MGRTLSVVALLVAFVALGLGGWLTLYPNTFRAAPAETFTAEQRDQAKAEACQAYRTVSAGVFENTNRQSPGPPEDATAGMVVVANAKIALLEGGQYVRARISPATPTDLAAAMTRFGDSLMAIGAGANAGVLDDDPAQAELFKNADTVNNEIKALCP